MTTNLQPPSSHLTPSNSPLSGGGKKRYVALQKLNHNKTKVDAGQVIELTQQEAVFLLKAKYIREATDADAEAVTIIGNPIVGTDSLVEALQIQLNEKDADITEYKATIEYQEKINDNFRQRSQLRLDFINQLIAERKATHALLYSKMTKDELNAELDKRGIEHDAKAKNEDLEALLITDDEAFVYVENLDGEDPVGNESGETNLDETTDSETSETDA